MALAIPIKESGRPSKCLGSLSTVVSFGCCTSSPVSGRSLTHRNQTARTSILDRTSDGSRALNLQGYERLERPWSRFVHCRLSAAQLLPVRVTPDRTGIIFFGFLWSSFSGSMPFVPSFCPVEFAEREASAAVFHTGPPCCSR